MNKLIIPLVACITCAIIVSITAVTVRPEQNLNIANEKKVKILAAAGIQTNKVDEEKIEKSVQDLFDLSPRGIREHLKLTNAIYVPTSAYGHFGREPSDKGHFTWEKTDLVESLKGIA